MKSNNIFKNIPDKLHEELFDDIVSNDGIKIQRIVSQGDTTPTDEWYDQESDEWVIVLQGKATISFKNEDDIHLVLGEHINIPAHKKHRVSWTSEDEQTIWIAVHYLTSHLHT